MNKKRLLLLVCFLAFAQNSSAFNSAEAKLTLGENYERYKVMASVDLDPKSVWNTYLSLARANYTDPENSGWNNSCFVELNFMPNDVWSVSTNYSHSWDNNAIVATGPGISAFYTQFRNVMRDGFEMPSNVFTVGVDCPVLFYQADVETAVDPVTTRQITLTQMSPMIFLDIALIPNLLNANVSGSYFLYSDDPTQIAEIVDPTVSMSAASSLESFMLSMLWMSWQTGVYVNFSSKIQLSANYGRQKQVYPQEWVDQVDIGLSAKLSGFLKAKTTWRHYSSSAGQSNLFSIGLRVYY